jgi:transposase InsO family protein
MIHTINYRILQVFCFISHDRRELIHFDVTPSPTAAWIWRQLLEATPWGRQPVHLIHDRDSVYGRDFDRHAAQLGITGLRTPPRAPKANSIAERLVETIRRECLDHVIVVSEDHLQRVLAEFTHYYNHDRPHRTLSLQTPVRYANPGQSPVVSTPVLGGQHHAYARAA